MFWNSKIRRKAPVIETFLTKNRTQWQALFSRIFWNFSEQPNCITSGNNASKMCKTWKGFMSKDRYQRSTTRLLLILHWKYITTSPNLFRVNEKSAVRVTNYVNVATFCFFAQIFSFFCLARSFCNTRIPVNKIVNEEVKFIWVGMKGSMWNRINMYDVLKEERGSRKVIFLMLST